MLKGENEPCRFYVGQHIQYNKNPYEFDGYLGSGDVILNSVKKYGKENFKRETLEVCKSLKHMNERELFWIEELKANFKDYPENGGMNIFEFTNCNGRFSTINSREKCSKSLLGDKNPMYGRKQSDASIEKNRQFNIGRYPSKETLQKLSEKSKGYNNPSNPYIYTLSNGENYFEFFDLNQRTKINRLFIFNETNILEFEGITIKRELIGKKYYNYILSNGEDFKSYFTKCQQRKIIQKFSKENADVVHHTGITITRILKTENNKADLDKRSKYIFKLSNNENYYDFFNPKERNAIRSLFSHYKLNIVKYKNIIITRISKNIIEYEYILSNNEKFTKYFSSNQRKRIKGKFSDNINVVEHAGITITRIIKNKVEGENKNG